MKPARPLVACGACGCHSGAADPVCHECGAPLRRADGSVPRTRVAIALGLTAVALAGPACSGIEPRALYGVALTDDDDDGYDSGVDCNDANDAIHPDADETAGDGVDSNCDGNDDV